ncbi:MAG TPA: lactate utilization protein, partial [Candidatus Ozemobacteraceae bacterium]|nr:lactate utilization protein [Candidatus Ozemobacteraceae bacterium]
MTTLEQAIQALKANGFTARLHADRHQAVQAVLAEIPDKVSIGRCGSVTCTELGLYDRLVHRGNLLIDPYQPHLTPEEKDATRRKTQQSDVLLTGTNAVTLDGKLVNIDGVGNRVTAQVFGPGHVIIVIGRNKLVTDVHAAIRRIKTIACPLNAKRLKLE